MRRRFGILMRRLTSALAMINRLRGFTIWKNEQRNLENVSSFLPKRFHGVPSITAWPINWSARELVSAPITARLTTAFRVAFAGKKRANQSFFYAWLRLPNRV